MKWISVKDRLPAKDGYLIVMNEKGSIYFNVEHADTGYSFGDGFYIEDCCYVRDIKDIKYWMYQDECEIYLKFLLK